MTKIQLVFAPQVFLLNDSICKEGSGGEEKIGTNVILLLVAARLLISQYWKENHGSDWRRMVYGKAWNIMLIHKLSAFQIRIRPVQALEYFKNILKPFVEYCKIKCMEGTNFSPKLWIYKWSMWEIIVKGCHLEKKNIQGSNRIMDHLQDTTSVGVIRGKPCQWIIGWPELTTIKYFSHAGEEDKMNSWHTWWSYLAGWGFWLVR